MAVTIISRIIAGGAGVLAAGAALALMLSDIEPHNPSAWRLDHALMPVVLTLTIVGLHFIKTTWSDRRFGSCFGWGLVVLVGTLVTLYTSLGRQNDTTDRQIKQAEQINRERADLHGQIVATGKLLDKARAEQIAKCGVDPDSDRCRGARSNLRTFTSAIEREQDKLKALGPEQTAAPKATIMAATVALFISVDEQLLRRRIIALEPLLFTLLFEIGASVAFSHAFAPRRKATVVQVASATVVRAAQSAKAQSATVAQLVADNPEQLKATVVQIDNATVVRAAQPAKAQSATVAQLVADNPGQPKATVVQIDSATVVRDAQPAKAQSATVAQLVADNPGQPKATVVRVVPEPPQPTPPRGSRRRPGATEADARSVVVQLRVVDSQQGLADRLGVNKGTVSRWMAKWEAEGWITREADGRCKITSQKLRVA